MANSLKQLGLNIAVAREKRGLTQLQFAELVKVKQGTVSSWEGGRIDIPYSTLCKIATALKTSPARLSDKSIPVEDSLDAYRLKAITLILGTTDEEKLGHAITFLETDLASLLASLDNPESSTG